MAASMLAAGCLGGNKARPQGRLARLLATDAIEARVTKDPSQVRSRPAALRLVISAVMAVSGVVAIGGLIGIVVGLVAAAIVARQRRGPKLPQLDLEDLPVVVDLVAGCLAAGATLPDALDAGAAATDHVLRAACGRVASALRGGAPAEEAWQPWLTDPRLAPVARTMVRTAQSGAAAAEDLRRASTRLRTERRASAQHRVRQASVWLVVPLGLCFLPAFVLVAVVPLVVGLVPSLL